jgi:hypothetical protein
MVKLSVDFEHASRTWWESGGRELWEGITGDGESGVVLDDDLAESWLREARKVPGWDDGPDYAPHPIAVSPVAPDDELA